MQMYTISQLIRLMCFNSINNIFLTGSPRVTTLRQVRENSTAVSEQQAIKMPKNIYFAQIKTLINLMGGRNRTAYMYILHSGLASLD